MRGCDEGRIIKAWRLRYRGRYSFARGSRAGARPRRRPGGGPREGSPFVGPGRSTRPRRDGEARRGSLETPPLGTRGPRGRRHGSEASPPERAPRGRGRPARAGEHRPVRGRAGRPGPGVPDVPAPPPPERGEADGGGAQGALPDPGPGGDDGPPAPPALPLPPG